MSQAESNFIKPDASVPPAPLSISGEARQDATWDGPRFFNRDLSWLEFNRRVLRQAADQRIPLLERVKFLAIFTSNLDEFFMKRVGLLRRLMQSEPNSLSHDGMTPRQQLIAIRAVVNELIAEQGAIYTNDVLPALTAADIHIVNYKDLSARDKRYVDEWYRAHIFASLTPLAVDSGHRFPFISNLSDNISVLASPPPRAGHLAGADSDEPRFARVKIPVGAGVRRFVPIPTRPGARTSKRTDRFVPLLDVISHNLNDLFPGVKILEQAAFRVTRSAGVQRDDVIEMGTGSLMRSVEEDLKQRRFARAVRLELDSNASQELRQWLLDKLSLVPQDIYEHPTIDFASLFEIAEVDRPDLKDRPYRPVIPVRFASAMKGATGATGSAAAESAAANFFACIRKQDVLVHHPYESFKHSVERFIAAAAGDPDVVAIKQTLYRTTPDSPFVENLIRAAESGKQVACLVELRARFDEGRNVRFARQLEKAGVHVAYGVAGLKTHCKTSLVVRHERTGLRCYAHLGTGNYHPKTAQLYTDVGLFTCDPEITGDLVTLFNYLTGISAPQNYAHLLVAPFTMRQRFNFLIDREMEYARRGQPCGITAKVNALEDREVAEKLYQASRAGVPITLIVRGFCCLRPGVPGLSENIRVVSVIGRFLEHSRIFHFQSGVEDPLDGEWLISSADWMYRNLSNRVEVAVPIRDRDARRKLHRIFEVSLQDQRNAWDLQPDGTYIQRRPGEDAEPDSPQASGTFNTLMWEAGGQ
ncbi:MAG: polyphosphate kinase 1 [Planctomycetes bacterium]|nr:polyphosphate kinase 1 [Planctomycetota bacterium]